ncbi:MAG: cytochrome c peroxidase [Gammaproteobacteria bacterium]|nr:cytochrome c peroxidase [Gammaproteobacteria bacterium]
MPRLARHCWVRALLPALLGFSVTLPALAHQAPAPAKVFNAPTPGSYALPPIRQAPGGQVLDESRQPLSLQALFGQKLVVLSFIYTLCGDAQGCPMASMTLAQTAKRLAAHKDLAAQLRFISVSFDPARDTPEVLEDYARHFRPQGFDWRFVAAAPAEMRALLGGYRQDLQREGSELAHSLRVFLIDPQGRIRNEYTSGFLDSKLLGADIETLLLAPAESTSASPAASTGSGDPRGGYDSNAYASQSRALGARRPEALDLRARLKAGEAGLPALRGPLPTSAQIALGRRLFFDRRLSHNNTLSCASCHVPEQGFTSNELATPVGIEGRTVRRNAPTLLNVGLLPRLFVDSRESRLEQQVWAPLLAANEMGNPSIGFVLEKVTGLKDYAGQFEAAFDGKPASMETLGAALAAYERSLIAGDSPFDRWRAGRPEPDFSPAAERGFALFSGKAACSSCHTLSASDALFTDHGLHNTGVGFAQSMHTPAHTAPVTLAPGTQVPVLARDRAVELLENAQDLGRYEVTQQPADRWRFRTPSLRNVALTAPFMHDGSLPDLAAVIDFYNAGGIANEGLDLRLKPLGLSTAERADLVSFLHALTGHSVPALVRDAWAAPIGDATRR